MYPQSVLTIRRFHESTRRRWCRLALAGFAFTPFGFVMVLSLIMAAPWYREWEKAAWERRVSDTLGIEIQADTFRWTAPYQFHADSIAIFHPETRALLGRIASIDGLMKPQGWSVILTSPSIDGEQWNSSLDVLHDWFLCRPQKSSQLLALAIPDGLSLYQGAEKTTLNRIDVIFRPSPTVSSIHAKWILEDQPFGEVAFHVSREHTSDDATTRLQLSCPGVWIPSSMVAGRLPAFDGLGEASRFRGVIHYQGNRRTWDAMVAGAWQNVDFGKLTGSMGSPLVGRGRLEFEQLHLRDGRILKTTGEFGMQMGMVSRRWLQHVSENLKLPFQIQQGAAELMAMDLAGFRFALDPTGVRLTGLMPGPTHLPPIAAKLGESILFADGTLTPVHQLAQTLQNSPLTNGAPISSPDGPSPMSTFLPVPLDINNDRRDSPAAESLRSRLSRNGDRSVPR